MNALAAIFSILASIVAIIVYLIIALFSPNSDTNRMTGGDNYTLNDDDRILGDESDEYTIVGDESDESGKYTAVNANDDTNIQSPRRIGGKQLPSTATPEQHAAEKYRRPQPKLTFREFCNPREWAIQPQQKFAADYIADGKTREMLFVHRIGAGKTCLGIQVGRVFLRNQTRGQPLFIMPASLLPGFASELAGPCGENAGLRAMSYNKFLTEHKNIDAPMICIDEVQNISNTSGKYYRAVASWIDAHPTATVIIMTATPIFDSPEELLGIARLLRIPVPDTLPTPAEVANMFSGKVSFFAGAPAFTYPAVEVKLVTVVMSPHQARYYTADAKVDHAKTNHASAPSNSFYIKTRQRSNVVYPSGETGSVGLSKLTPKMIHDDLHTYSAKLAHMVRRLRGRTGGKLSFVYSNFSGYGGIRLIVKVLTACGYQDYFKAGPGPRRFALWTGEESLGRKREIVAAYNDPANDDASRLQVVIGSPAIKEGVSFKRCRKVFVLEYHWNYSRIEQIFGRAVRYCSHKSLPTEDRRVKIYIYAATTRRVLPSEISSVGAETSVDLYMLGLAEQKRARAAEYLDALISTAVDRYLWA